MKRLIIIIVLLLSVILISCEPHESIKINIKTDTDTVYRHPDEYKWY